jgi:N-acetylglutamate synthase-like GNAT family acetyltransferase
MAPIIREATREDAALLLRLIRESFETVYQRFDLRPEKWPGHAANKTPAWILEAMDNAQRFFILEESGEPCGCVALEIGEGGTAHLRRLAVLPAFRRRGFGRRLVDHVLAQARRLAARRVVLGIVAANMELQQWYERQGFAVTDRKRYDEVPFEVTHMALEIVQPRPHAAAIVVRRRTGDG